MDWEREKERKKQTNKKTNKSWGYEKIKKNKQYILDQTC